MKVIIDRDSVCAGDDIDGHDEVRRYEPQIRFAAVVDYIIASGFLPSMDYPLHSWSVYVDDVPIAALSGNASIRHLLVEPAKELQNVCKAKDIATIYFKYHTNIGDRDLFLSLFQKTSL